MAKVVRDDTGVELVPDVPEVADTPDEREEFGLRVTWQSEDERIEAAEFMIATRMQEDARRRIAAAALAVRQHTRDEITSAVHRDPAEDGSGPAD